MLNYGKTKSQQRDLAELLSSPHNIRMRVRLLDLNHKYLKDLTDRFADGMVTVDNTSEVTRSMDITLFDPFQKVRIDPNTPARSSVFIADMISVVYVISNPTLTQLYEIPVFCGPIDDVDRDDVWLTVKCLGKESLNLQNSWRAKTFKKGEKKTDVIKEILRRYCGETRMKIPDLKAKLPNDLKLTREKSPWAVAVGVARTMGMQLFYDARGYAVLRRRGKKPVFKFTERHVTTEAVKVSYDISSVVNAVQVIGKKPKKSKKRIKYTAVAPRRHPLSPWRLGRGTAPRFLWERIEDDGIESKKEAKEVARRQLARGLLAGVEITFNGIPHPALQEGDICQIKTERLATKFVLDKFTIPLVAGADSSYGYLRRLTPKGGARGVKRRRKRKGGKGGKGGGKDGGKGGDR